MNAIAQLEQRRAEILGEMAGIRSLERATLSEQMMRVPQKGKKEGVLRGPYYVLARWQGGKTRSRRVGREELERVRRDVANRERFLALSEEFMDLTQRLGEVERKADAEQEALKKGLKSRSNKAGKSLG